VRDPGLQEVGVKVDLSLEGDEDADVANLENGHGGVHGTHQEKKGRAAVIRSHPVEESRSEADH
jgi:hypothetical protein